MENPASNLYHDFSLQDDTAKVHHATLCFHEASCSLYAAKSMPVCPRITNWFRTSNPHRLETQQPPLWKLCTGACGSIWFNVSSVPALVYICIHGFCRHFLLMARGNTTWELSSLGTPVTAYHLQAVLDLPVPLTANSRKSTRRKQCLTSLRSASCSSQPGEGASASKMLQPGVSWVDELR